MKNKIKKLLIVFAAWLLVGTILNIFFEQNIDWLIITLPFWGSTVALFSYLIGALFFIFISENLKKK